MKELVIISGKGGTGKTSVTAAFALLADDAVIVDADVDAADMHLLAQPKILHEEDFFGGSKAIINQNLCSSCGLCIEHCAFDAISNDFVVKTIGCEGCGVCVHVCPENAIDFPKRLSGRWFVSNTRFGSMVHARLGIAEENSGKLVALVRSKGRELAQKQGAGLMLTDGPPGIGCPVIAAVTGASAVLIVTEPTVSGNHDMERTAKLARHFGVEALVAVNKEDLNPQVSAQIAQYALDNNMTFLGGIPYDKDVTRAMVEGKSVVEFSSGPATTAIKTLWEKIVNHLAAMPDPM
ncbi:MAG: ATP-binding protein [Desulfatibacillaceae bacterium]|nr:ATP-binding protein [Desulfatibacillaceae bacterium]